MGIEKIATCCYCGARAALVLRGDVRHELSCASCGAPLHALKRLRSEAAPAPAPRPHPHPAPRDKQRERRPEKYRSDSYKSEKYHSRRPVKSKRRFGRRLLSEIVDVIEDIFD